MRECAGWGWSVAERTLSHPTLSMELNLLFGRRFVDLFEVLLDVGLIEQRNLVAVDLAARVGVRGRRL